MSDNELRHPDDVLNRVLTSAVGSLFSDATEAEIAQLERLVLDDDQACKFYVDTIIDSLVLRRWSEESPDSVLVATVEAGLGEHQGALEFAAADLAGDRRTSLPSLSPLPSPLSSLPSPLSSLPSPLSSLPSVLGGWPVAYLVATVVFGIALAIGSILHVSRPVQTVEQRPANAPTRESVTTTMPVVGRITGMADCECEGTGFRIQGSGDANHPSEIRNHKSAIHLGDRLSLRSGLLEIAYDTGAHVILEGPVTYEVESAAGGYLPIGKLTAKLEKNSEVRDQKFVVRTPTALVTDLGTEFGVEVDKNGVTVSHVFRGSVRVQKFSVNGTPEEGGRVLRENESATIVDGAAAISVAPTPRSRTFVRHIPKPAEKTVDLVDIVAGGDGFSCQRDRGIDPTSGRLVFSFPHKHYQSETEFPVGDGRYHRVRELPMVDGVFVPDGRRGPVQVDSAGHAFDGFTSASAYAPGPMWSYGRLPNDVQAPRTKLDGIDYASPGHGALYLHANSGITFDLQAIRRVNPGCDVLRFRAVAANAATEAAKGGRDMRSDLWVLVDGERRYSRRDINDQTGAFSIAVPIRPQDWFLTLASTDAGDGVGADQIILGDPRLELLEPRQVPVLQPK